MEDIFKYVILLLFSFMHVAEGPEACTTSERLCEIVPKV